jgi:hypothetical protein
VTWHNGFKLSDVEKYDGTSNFVYWIQVYSTTIKVVVGNSDLMVNYLPVMLAKGCKSWLNS